MDCLRCLRGRVDRLDPRRGTSPRPLGDGQPTGDRHRHALSPATSDRRAASCRHRPGLASGPPSPPPPAPAGEPGGYYAAPIERSAIEIPREAAVIPFDDGVVNIAILGSGGRPFTGGGPPPPTPRAPPP